MFKATTSLLLLVLLFTTSHKDSILTVVDALTSSTHASANDDVDNLLRESSEDGKETEDKDDLTDNTDDFIFSEYPFQVLVAAHTFIFSKHVKFSNTDFSRELLSPPEHA